jgi:hypothetical protein
MMVLRGNQTFYLPPFMRQILFRKYMIRIVAARKICLLFYKWAITHRRIPKVNFTGCTFNAADKRDFFMVVYTKDEDYDNDRIVAYMITSSSERYTQNMLTSHKSVRRLSLLMSRFKTLEITSSSYPRRKMLDTLECCVILAYIAFHLLLLNKLWLRIPFSLDIYGWLFGR